MDEGRFKRTFTMNWQAVWVILLGVALVCGSAVAITYLAASGGGC